IPDLPAVPGEQAGAQDEGGSLVRRARPGRGARRTRARSTSKGVPWYDVLLALVGLGANMYTVVMYDHLSSNLVQIMGFRDIDYAVAAVGIVLTLEATRRCVGLPIVVIALGAIAYSILGAGQSWDNYVVGTFFTSRAGIFGTPIQVSSTFIYLFLFFAVVLIRTNIGTLFTD